MADPPAYPGTHNERSEERGTEPPARRSLRTAVIWILVIALLLVMVILHLTGALGAGMHG
jgi:predicted nucleic acid-binding Zn ribbon protein